MHNSSVINTTAASYDEIEKLLLPARRRGCRGGRGQFTEWSYDRWRRWQASRL